jgi:molybdate transport system substrate-binding protein
MRRWLALAISVAALAACGGGGDATRAPGASAAAGSTAGPSGSAGPVLTLTIFADASLTGALTAARTAYEAATPGVKLTLVFGSSAALRTQIQKGAAADAFISADLATAQALVTDHLAGGPATPLVADRLAIVVPSANHAKIRTPKDLARSGVRIVGAAASVPITVAANQLLAALAKLSGYPAGFVRLVAHNTKATRADDAAVVAAIEAGSADAAIVYATDATGNAKVRTIAIPATVEVTSTVASVEVARSANPLESAAFLGWLMSPMGQQIFASLGFLPAGTT